MNSSMKKLAIAVTAAVAIALVSGADGANARAGKHSRVLAPPPPSWGYFASIPVVLDYAQAQAMSLEHPYYTHFMYDYCDYRNCVLRWSGSAWVPVWNGPVY